MEFVDAIAPRRMAKERKIAAGPITGWARTMNTFSAMPGFPRLFAVSPGPAMESVAAAMPNEHNHQKNQKNRCRRALRGSRTPRDFGFFSRCGDSGPAPVTKIETASPAEKALKLFIRVGSNHEISGMGPAGLSADAASLPSAMRNHPRIAIWNATVQYWKILAEVIPR